MAKEYEHKYILRPNTTVESLKQNGILKAPINIEQVYIAVDSKRKYVSRVRCIESFNWFKVYHECHKIGSGKDTEEIEYNISEKTFNELKTHCRIGNIINKTRYKYTDKCGLVWDVDNYSTGEWIAELENPPDDYVFPFRVIDVTDDFRYSNISIALNGFPRV